MLISFPYSRKPEITSPSRFANSAPQLWSLLADVGENTSMGSHIDIPIGKASENYRGDFRRAVARGAKTRRPRRFDAAHLDGKGAPSSRRRKQSGQSGVQAAFRQLQGQGLQVEVRRASWAKIRDLAYEDR